MINQQKIANPLNFDSPSVYVACLASYNSGILHGAWIDASRGVDALESDIKAMLAASPEPGAGAEEWAIHDIQGFYGLLGEYHNMEEICEIAEKLSESENPELLAALVEHFGGDFSDAETALENCYVGSYESDLDFAYSYIEAAGLLTGVNETVLKYFDYESFSRDLMFDHFSIEIGSEAHYFSNL